MFKKTLKTLVLAISILALTIPAFAYARNNGDNNSNNRNEYKSEQRANLKVESTNEFGVHVFEDKNNKRDDRRDDFLSTFFYSGTVTAVSGSTITIQTKDNKTLTVQAATAKIIRIPRTEISVSNIAVGDMVHVTGTKSNSTINASVVYDLSSNLKPAKAKGTVTSIDGNTMTVQTKDNKTATVNVTADTQVVTSNNQTGTTADVQVGSKVKLFGLWDNILNVFNALKIKVK